MFFVESTSEFHCGDRDMALQPAASAHSAADAVQPIPVVLNGRALEANRGIPLNLDWVEKVRINTSAVERRATTHCARRTVKKENQAAWLLRAIACMDLTTLSGDDSADRVRRLCAKARQPAAAAHCGGRWGLRSCT